MGRSENLPFFDENAFDNFTWNLLRYHANYNMKKSRTCHLAMPRLPRIRIRIQDRLLNQSC